MSGLEAPAIIGIIGAVTAVVGTGISVYSNIQQANAAAAAAESEQEMRNAEAASAREAAAYEERQFRRRASLLQGKQSAILAASGFDITSGSPNALELDTIQQAELEALNIRRTGEISASSREFEGRLARLRGGYAKSQIPTMAVGGAFKAGSSILGSWSSYQTKSKSYYPSVVLSDAL